MTPRLLMFTNAAILAVASRQMLANEEHLVVPVIAAREGVMNGLFYSRDELALSANAWNGVPIPVYHPKEGDTFVTANSPQGEEKWNIGKFFNINFDPNTAALKGELWLNIAKATKLGYGEVITRLEGGEVMNVSTGLFSTNTLEEEGKFNGVDYCGKVVGIMPDHLALLPNELGACSTAQGCGTFIHNHAHGEACCDSCASKKEVKRKPGLFGNLSALVLNALGFKTNEASHEQIRESLRCKLRENRPDNYWPYIMDVYDKFFVYEVDGLLFKQGYAMDAAEATQLVGDPIQVVIKREYVEVNPITTNQLETVKQSPLVTTILAAALTANTITKAEHDAMGALPEGTLDKLLGNGAQPPAAAPATTAPNVIPLANGLNDDERLLLNELKQEREQRLVTLRANTKVAYPSLAPAIIDTMSAPQLEGLLANVGQGSPVVNYGLAGGGAGASPSGGQPAYEAPSILANTGDLKMPEAKA